MKFILEIELGNDAMLTLGDLAAALRCVALKLDDIDDGLPVEEDEIGGIMDDNGNRVGKWEVVDNG